MGYDVKYDFDLHVDDKDLKQTLYYDRGPCGWEGDAPPPGHKGEGLDSVMGEWCITIENGKVEMQFNSEKFYDHYMTRMLKLLKERVPSLRGFASCDLDIYWLVTNKVIRRARPGCIHELARLEYEKSARPMLERRKRRRPSDEAGEDSENGSEDVQA